MRVWITRFVYSPNLPQSWGYWFDQVFPPSFDQEILSVAPRWAGPPPVVSKSPSRLTPNDHCLSPAEISGIVFGRLVFKATEVV